MKYNENLLIEALRYLGVKGQAPADVAQQVRQALDRLLPLCSPHSVWCVLDKTAFADLGLELPGQDIHQLLKDCDRAVLFALTLGAGPEQLIRREGLRSPTAALILDACASAACEQACDDLQRQLEEQLCSPGIFSTDRFSPGYGDLPLEFQKEIFKVLDCPKRIGLTLNESMLMSPTKSVTAFVGITK